VESSTISWRAWSYLEKKLRKPSNMEKKRETNGKG
jgi:hypothetical protein